MRPVRPILWTYSSISFGRSKFMTCWTFLISSPRAATFVAIRTGQRPFLKSTRASSRSLCNLSLIKQISKNHISSKFLGSKDTTQTKHKISLSSSSTKFDVCKKAKSNSKWHINFKISSHPCMEVVGNPSWLSQLARKSAERFDSTKTSVLSCPVAQQIKIKFQET